MIDKVREDRLRRVAQRRGLELTKSRRRDPQAWDYGIYQLVNGDGEVLLATANLDTVERSLTGSGQRQRVRDYAERLAALLNEAQGDTIHLKVSQDADGLNVLTLVGLADGVERPTVADDIKISVVSDADGVLWEVAE